MALLFPLKLMRQRYTGIIEPSVLDVVIEELSLAVILDQRIVLILTFLNDSRARLRPVQVVVSVFRPRCLKR